MVIRPILRMYNHFCCLHDPRIDVDGASPPRRRAREVLLAPAIRLGY